LLLNLGNRIPVFFSSNFCRFLYSRPNTTLKWKLHNELPKLNKAKTRQLIQQAFDDWARFSPLTFREANRTEKADFNLSFLVGNHADRFPFDGPGGNLAHGFFPKDGRIHFDATEDWTDK